MADMILDVTTYVLPLFAVLTALLVVTTVAIVAGSWLGGMGRARRVAPQERVRVAPSGGVMSRARGDGHHGAQRTATGAT